MLNRKIIHNPFNMKTIEFDIKLRPEIESGKYRVVTASGKQAKVLDWEFLRGGSKVLVVKVRDYEAHEEAYFYNPSGTKISSEDDRLLLKTDEMEMDDFQTELSKVICSAVGAVRTERKDNPDGDMEFSNLMAVMHSDKLASIVRMRLGHEVDALIDRQKDDIFAQGTAKGRADAMREAENDGKAGTYFKWGKLAGEFDLWAKLPRWKPLGAVNGIDGGRNNGVCIQNICFAGGGVVPCLVMDGRYIELSELDKLKGDD